MKRMISVILLLGIILGVGSSSIAASVVIPKDVDNYLMDDYFTHIFEFYRHFMDQPGGWDSLAHDEIYDYNRYAEELKNNAVFQASLDAVHLLTDTSWTDIFSDKYGAEDIKVQYYVTALSSLLMTMEDNFSDVRTSQAKATSSKMWNDYLADAGKITADFFSKNTGLNGKTDWEKAFKTCGLSLDMLSDVLNTEQRCEALQLNAEKYISYRNLCEAVERNTTDPYLTEAVKYIYLAVDQSFRYRMEHFLEYADIAIELQSDKFFDVLNKVLTEADSSVFSAGELTALGVTCNMAEGFGYFNLGVDLGKFAGDVLIGSSDHIQRYYETCAMASVRQAIINEVKSRDTGIKSVDDVEEIPDIIELLRALNYVNVRGAYCEYRILTKDVGVISGVNNIINGDTINDWFDCVQKISQYTDNNLESIVPDIEEYRMEANSLAVKMDNCSNYADVIRVLMSDIAYDSQDAQLKARHRGYYCDIDKDGADELLIRYLKNIDGRLSHVCGIWDMNANGVYNVLSECFGDEQNSVWAAVTVFLHNNEYLLRLGNRAYVEEGNSEIIIDEQNTKTYRCSDMSLTLLHNTHSKIYYRQDDQGEYINVNNPNKYIIDPVLSSYKIDEHIFDSGNSYWTFYQSLSELDDTYTDYLELSAYEFAPEGIIIEGYLLPELIEILGNTSNDRMESKKGDILFVDSYKEILAQYPEYEEKPWGKEYTEYTLYDIDKNGMPEMIIKCPDTKKYDVYTDKGGGVTVKCGEICFLFCGDYAQLYGCSGNGIIVHSGGSGSLRIETLHLQQLTENSLTDGSLIISTEEKAFSELEDTLKKYTLLDDFSGISEHIP